MGTKLNPPVSGDCYAAAEPDEPIFILLARDKASPGLLRAWANGREDQIQSGEKPSSDMAKVREARQIAADMTKWRNAKKGIE